MTKEQLLKPRWKVIADFPDSDYKVGSIEDRDWCKYVNSEDETDGIVWKISDFPHLFKELKWWEHREPSEMPSYVKMCKDIPTSEIKVGQVLKVIFWKIDEGDDKIHFAFEGDVKNIGCYPDYYTPSTEEEYLSSLA